MDFDIYREEDINDGHYEGNQKNILMFIGNGFDMRILLKLYMTEYMTSYSDFYDWLTKKSRSQNNILVNMMREAKNSFDKGNRVYENWSDFEWQLIRGIDAGYSLSDLNSDLEELQYSFAEFLNDIVSVDILKEINYYASEAKSASAMTLFKDFLGDLSKEDLARISFAKQGKDYEDQNGINHYTLFNWTFLNFNYTMIFDNFINLNKSIYDTRPHMSANTNLTFHPDPNNFRVKKYVKESGFPIDSKVFFSSYLVSSINHPHGLKEIPSSMLFGFSNVNQLSKKFKDSEVKNFLKPYWFQGTTKYQRLLNNADLFIIFGMSLGATDSWWWYNVTQQLLKNQSKELIVYYYEPGGQIDCKKIVLEKLIKCLTCEQVQRLYELTNNIVREQILEIEDKKRSIIEALKAKVFVVPFNDSTELKICKF